MEEQKYVFQIDLMCNSCRQGEKAYQCANLLAQRRDFYKIFLQCLSEHQLEINN